MKKIFVSVIALALCAGAVQAQQNDQQQGDQQHMGRFNHGGPGGFGGRGHDMMMGRMMEQKLNFTDQQKQQVKDINQKYHQQLADLNKNLDITVREQREKMASLRKDHMTQLQGVLTADQKAQIQKMKDERAELAKVNAKAREDKMKIKLGLTDEQAQKLKDLRTTTFTKMKELRSNQSLTPDQKKAQITAIMKDQKEQMKTVLTPEQLKQLDEMHHGHQRGEWSK